MEKFFKKILIGSITLICVFCITDVNAGQFGQANLNNGAGTENLTVTVGEVETPIYSATISWEDLTFDWKYDNTTSKYNWTHADECVTKNYTKTSASETQTDNVHYYYESNNCTGTGYSFANLTVGTTYNSGKVASSALITVRDESENARISSTISFVPSSSYSWTDGKFYYDVTDNQETTRTLLPSSAMIYEYVGLNDDSVSVYDSNVYLELSVNNETHDAPTAGETIGTVTINISPAA